MNKSIFCTILFVTSIINASSQIDMGGVDIQGDLSILDNPDTLTKEGNLIVENNALINGTLTLNHLTSNGNPFAFQLGGIVDEYKTGIAIGADSHVTGSYSIAIGQNAVSSGNYSFALGLSALASQGSSAALGANTKTLAPNSVAVGAGSTTEGEASFAAGLNSNAKGRASSSLGYATTAESFSQVTVGRLNEVHGNASTTEWVATDPLFVIGNGDGAKRSNAMVVLKNGDLIVNGVIRSTKVSDALPMGEFGPEGEASSGEIQSQSAESAIEPAVPEIE